MTMTRYFLNDYDYVYYRKVKRGSKYQGSGTLLVMLYYTGNPCMAVIMALMNEINPIWTKRLDGIDFVSRFKGDGFALHFTKGLTP